MRFVTVVRELNAGLMSHWTVPPSVRVRVSTPPLWLAVLTKSFVLLGPPLPVWSSAYCRFLPESVANTRSASMEGRNWSVE